MRSKEVSTRLQKEIDDVGFIEFTTSMTPSEAGTRRAVASRITGVSFRLRDEGDLELTEYGRAIAAQPKVTVGTTRVEDLEAFDRYTTLVYQLKNS